MGPLVVGYEVQSDYSINTSTTNNGTRTLENATSGTLTDAIESSQQTDDGRLNSLLKVKQIYADGRFLSFKLLSLVASSDNTLSDFCIDFNNC